MLAMTKNLTSWEDRRWIGVPNNSPLRALAAGLCQRTRKTTLAITKTSPGNTAASALAQSGASSKTEEDNIHLDVPLDSRLPGARLSSLTQSIAYKGIKEMREPVSRKKTDEIVKGCALPRKWWLNIPECEERANCVHCGAEETLDHFLLQCPSPGQSEVQKLAEKLWTKKESNGSGLAVFKDDSGKPQPALVRLYKILMTELAHVIWKLRCDSMIGHEGTPLSMHEVHNRWVKVMNECLEIDINLTNKLKYGKQHTLSPAVVLDTWHRTLLDKDTLPDNWLREPGVLSPPPPIGWWGCNR
ncbi:hypothetical protein B0H13DRAFT_2239580 [Mycena leptocephala]|nr:hypothetical protein B0H13DRAFT_2239580 [Mycena leptocephala]